MPNAKPFLAHPYMQNVEWEYAVIKSPVPNAGVLPGGKVNEPVTKTSPPQYTSASMYTG